MRCPRCETEFDAPKGALEAKCPSCDARIALTSQRTRASTRPGLEGAARANHLIGVNLGGYRVERLIGGGGMGLVYEGTRVGGDGPERVAIKVLSPAFAEDPDFVARFRREADALLRLRHPHLIEVYAKGEHSPEDREAPTAYFFIMERFDGVDLRRYVERGPVDVDAVVEIIRQASEGLGYAHAQGVVHRDIKPGNILVQGDPGRGGVVKVVDFGVAQLASLEHTLTSLTRSELILGTYNYMSPEQRVDASKVDHRTDVYALGVVAYELLTGSLPFGAFEPPSELRAGLPDAADAAVLGALRRDPAQRPHSVVAFATSLERAVRPDRTAGRRGLAWALVGLASILGLFLASGSLSTADGPRPSVDVVRGQGEEAPARPAASTRMASSSTSASKPDAAVVRARGRVSSERVEEVARQLEADAKRARELSLPPPTKRRENLRKKNEKRESPPAPPRDSKPPARKSRGAVGK